MFDLTLEQLKDRKKEKQKTLLNIFMSNTSPVLARLNEIEKIILETHTDLLLQEISLLSERIGEVSASLPRGQSIL